MTATLKRWIEGTVFNIQRYSLHDGPGIRTTAFLKGCPLRCRWCHNPESINPNVEVMPAQQAGSDALNPEPETVGRIMTSEAVADELARDRIFYEESGGGITLSGGEPLSQPEFAIDILRRCKSFGLHTAVDTCGFVNTCDLLTAAKHTDLFLYDMKHPDSSKHEEFTDAPNELIIENLRILCSEGANVLVRQPFVPGVNADPETVEQTGRLLESCGVKQLQLLPYHTLGKSKRHKLPADIPVMDFCAPSADQLETALTILAAFPFKTICEE